MIDTKTRQQIIDDFHVLFYEEARKGITWGGTTYCGVKLWKSPLDLQIYQELVWTLRPKLIIETGTAFGGSALFFAHLFDQIGDGRVLTIDLKEVERNYPHHYRIEYMGGHSSVGDNPVVAARERAHSEGDPVMVILDSDHAAQHVLAELNCYAELVSPNSYLVVEDTNVGGHPVYKEHGPGPQEALDVWLPKHPEFAVDERLPQTMLFSMHTWLRRRRG